MDVEIAVSLPDELVAAARRAVDDGRADSVSGFVADAMRRREQEDGLAALLDDLDAEHGEPDAEDKAWADRALGLR